MSDRDDDELLASLRGAPPPEVMGDALFWARLQRDVSAQLARRRRVVRLGSFAVAASLAIGFFVVRSHHGAKPAVLAETFDDEPEASLGVAVEELSDEEVARAMKNFHNGG